jgi:hypothetical protein
MFSRRSLSLAPRLFAMVPLLLLAFRQHPGKELFVATSVDDRALTMRIKALSPAVSLDEAWRVTYCAVSTGREMAREWHVVPGASWVPGLQNLFILMGARKGGFCFQYSTELLVRLDALKLKTLEFHWAESDPNTMDENNAIVVTARGQRFEQGVLLDSWRAQPYVTWTQVTKDPAYDWKENKSAAAQALRRANNEIFKSHR